MVSITFDTVKDINIENYGGGVQVKFDKIVLELSNESALLLMERLVEFYYEESVNSMFEKVEELNYNVHCLKEQIEDLTEENLLLRERITNLRLGVEDF